MLRQSILAILLIFVSTLGSVHSNASVHSKGSVENKLKILGDDRWTHWPWRLAQPIPWSDIQGIWKVEGSENVSYFSFKKIYGRNSDLRQISLKQIDPESCQVIGSGVGIEKGSFIYAQITNEDGAIFRLNLSAFKCSDSPLLPNEKNDCVDSMMVLSIGEVSVANLDQMLHMRIQKLTSDLNENICFIK